MMSPTSNPTERMNRFFQSKEQFLDEKSFEELVTDFANCGWKVDETVREIEARRLKLGIPFKEENKIRNIYQEMDLGFKRDVYSYFTAQDYFTPEAFIAKCLSVHKAEVDYAGNLIKNDRGELTEATILKYYERHYTSFRKYGIPSFSKATLFNEFNLKLQELKNKSISELTDQLKYDEKHENAVENFFKIFFKEGEQQNIVFFKHWLWQVKRKMLGLPVTYEMMLVIKGDQGTFKTSTMASILRPINKAVSNQILEQLLDPRITATLVSKRFVIVLDEIGKLGKYCDHFKNIVTSKDWEYRPMYSNTFRDVPNISTLIAMTNRDLSDIVKDDTGARRFFQLETNSREVALTHSQALKDFDYLSLWKSIDENKEAYLTNDDLKKQAEINSRLKCENEFDDYLAEFYIPDETKKEFVTWTEFYAHYRKYMIEGGYKPETRGKFTKLMSEKFKGGLSKYESNIRVNGRMTRVLYIQHSSEFKDLGADL